MPLEAATLEKASILRKLLAYQATINDNVLRAIFGMEHAYVLFLASGRRRRDNMVRLAQSAVTNKRAAQAMLFAVQPPAPTLGNTPDLSALSWKNGLGEEARLSL